jgi:hypothetical protein
MEKDLLPVVDMETTSLIPKAVPSLSKANVEDFIQG